MTVFLQAFTKNSAKGNKGEWRLEQWAVKNGVQSTSRYRKKNCRAPGLTSSNTSSASEPGIATPIRGHHNNSSSKNNEPTEPQYADLNQYGGPCHWGGVKSIQTSIGMSSDGGAGGGMNVYAEAQIEAFNSKLASMSVLSDKEKDMARSLAKVHNLANKGVKGRGKGRKLERVLPHQQQPQLRKFCMAPYPMAHPNHHYSSLDGLPAWPPSTAMLIRDTAYAHYHYDAHIDQLSYASSVYEPTTALYMGNEEYVQELAFGDRMF